MLIHKDEIKDNEALKIPEEKKQEVEINQKDIIENSEVK